MVFLREEDGVMISAREGTALAVVLSRDPAWTPVTPAAPDTAGGVRLEDMPRPDLDAVAADLGVDTSGMRTRRQVANAIRQAREDRG